MNTPPFLEAPMSFFFYWLFLIGGVIGLTGMIAGSILYLIYLLFYDKE